MKKGVFTISIDYEYAWGYVDQDITARHKQHITKEVEITERLLALFEKYEIPATWAIVGHLLTPHPRHGKDSLWYDTEGFVDAFKTSLVGHEVGSHSFVHIIYSECVEAEAIRDIEHAKRVHSLHGLPFSSFVFPRNKEGHHAKLKDAGLACFRGLSGWCSRVPGILGRGLRFLDYFLPYAQTSLPTRHSSGLINVPATMLLIGRNGLRKMVPTYLVKRKALKSLFRAAEKGELFHLWFHPSNFVHDVEAQFAIFEEILKQAKYMRDEKVIEILTMGEVAHTYEPL